MCQYLPSLKILHPLGFAAFALIGSGGFAHPQDARGLQVLYDFQEKEGDLVKDRSGAGEPVDLKIANPGAIRRGDGSLEIRGKTILRSVKPATRICEAVRKSGECTIEAWIRPANTSEEGPARIVTLSTDSNERNFTLGQQWSAFEVRFRTTKTSRNGQPTVNSPGKSLKTELTHVVYTRSRDGRARLFLNGKSADELNGAGDLSAWNLDYHLALGDEMNGSRSWLGTYYRVAIYNRALPETEIEIRFKQGLGAAIPVLVTEAKSASKVTPAAPPKSEETSVRTGPGLVALYDFTSPDGKFVRDRSAAGEPVDLRISDPKKVRLAEGSLEILGNTVIRSEKPATRISNAIKKSGSFTIEAWVQPANLNQEGPARIVTLSKNTSERSFTLGQDRDRFDVRFRTSRTDSNGSPSVNSPGKNPGPKLTHVVYTRGTTGHAQLYLDGRKSGERKADGDLSPWSGDFHLALGNEQTGERPWLGSFRLVAIYSRDLSSAEVARNFKVGPMTAGLPALMTENRSGSDHFFETRIAPLLANRCLECHDASTKKGKLDLSHKTAAFAAKDVIGPGKSAESLLWEMVESDEMPEDRDPLSAEDKKHLREWIQSGASWSMEMIDPVLYRQDETARQIWVQRLTVPEYIETVRSATGVDIAQEALKILPPDLRADGFSNTAYNLTVDFKHVEAYARLAEKIVSQMDVKAFVSRFSNSRRLDEDKQMNPLVADMGKWLLRGPLDEEEIFNFRGIMITVVSAGGDFDLAMNCVLEAMLQSPRFLYRIEKQHGGGTSWEVDDHELASRLSYIIQGGPPDRELLDLADRGGLRDRNQLEAQAKRLLDDPKALDRSLRFIYEWLDLGRLDNLQPDPRKFPQWNADLAVDMREETLAYFKEVVWDRNRPLSDLLNTQVTFATPRLAAHYGIAAGTAGPGTKRFDLSKVPSRGGILTQGSVLTIGGDEASMVTRGLFVFHDLLRGMVKEPPAGLDVTPVPTKAGVTHRTVAEQRIKNVSCGGCHSKFEPLAFGLEKFDGVGAFHHKDEHGNALREDGEILFPGSGEPLAYETSAELMDLLAASDRVRQSLTWKVAQFSLGRPLNAADASALQAIHQTASENGGTWPSLITALVTSDLVRTTRAESPSND